MGRGGSPTEFDQGIIDQETGRKLNLSSSNFSSPGKDSKKAKMIPIRRDNKTTVRVRTKNNSFIYGEQNLGDVLNPHMLSQTINMMDQHH